MLGKKRLISFLLAIVMLIGVMPLSVLAGEQPPAIISSIKATGTKKHPDYSILLEWTLPSMPSEEQIKGVKIKEINRLDGKETDIKTETGTATNSSIDRTGLVGGNIYEYVVIPFHEHTSEDGKTQVIEAKKPDSALFMTDIQVNAKGYGNTLEVTFDNPKYSGKNLFTGYRIYYQQGGSSVGSNNFNSQIDVPIESKDLVPSVDPITKVNRFTYKISNENIKPGNIYAVKVEPLYNGREIREQETNNIEIDKITKKISFNSKTSVEYRDNNAYVSIPLYVMEDGRDYLKLQWGDISGITTVDEIDKIEILSGVSEDKISTIIATIHGPTDIASVNSWRMSKPREKTYYKIRIKLKKGGFVESELAVYDPTIVNITPNKPLIYPKVGIENNKSFIDLYWDTFTRSPYNEDEEKLVDANGMYFDKKINYDLWVSDSLETLNKLGIPKILDKVPATSIPTTKIDEAKLPVFQHKVTEYVTVDELGNFIKKPIEENKTYFIRIVATKPTADGLGLSSEPSNSRIYIPPRGDISIPKTLAKPPFMVKKDENGIDMITKTEITITWDRKWFEVYSHNEETGNGTWYSKVAIRDGKLVFGNDVKETDKVIDFYNKATVEEAKQEFVKVGFSGEIPPIRQIDISSEDIKYELITKPLSEIEDAGGYEQYLEQLLASESKDWQEITPEFVGDVTADYTITSLKENTLYAILLRPYRILEDGKKEAYPAYLLATTLPTDVDVDIIPTVPILFEIDKTDISAEVGWETISNSLEYELLIDENALDDPSKAKRHIDIETIKKDAIPYEKDGKKYLKYNITGLFPDTGYYIWIRSKVAGKDKFSDWSTPLYIKTKEIIKPQPPSGFGLASEKSVSTYNTNNNTNYKPISDKYLILEWNRLHEDTAEDVKPDKNDKVEPLIDPNIKRRYMAKFNELIPNKYYYTRAKSKRTVIKTADGIEQAYSYIVEVSLDKSMKDAITVEIPKIEPKGDRVVSIESDWTEIFRYRTGFSPDGEGDYDGNIIDDFYPLPTEDFEIIYDAPSKTLTYRFRSNKKDSNGNADNGVDQRFITKLVNSKTFNYKIDLTSYKGYEIKNRRVEIPASIVSSLEQRKIAFSVTSGGTQFTLNPGFLNTPEAKKSNYNKNSVVMIDILEAKPTLPLINTNQKYATIPQSLKVSIDSNNVVTPLTYTGSNMDIKLKLKSRDLTVDKNVGAYRSLNDSAWERIPSTYNSETGIHVIKTNRLGAYTTMSNAVSSTNNNYGNDTMLLNSVNNRITFTDFKDVNTKTPISVVQFNNIVAGISNGKKEIAINGGLSDKDYQSLSRAGMLLQGSVVGKEAGVNVLVKLYENKTKTKFQPTSDINTTPYKDIKNANKVYQQNLIKAGDIGFFGDATNVNPKEAMTIEEMLYMVNIILDDSGY